MPTIHLVPCDSSGGSMKMALKKLHKTDTIIPFSDHLTYGPIANFPHADWRSRRLDWEVNTLYRNFSQDIFGSDMHEAVEHSIKRFHDGLRAITKADTLYIYYTQTTHDMLFAYLMGEHLAGSDVHLIHVETKRKNLHSLGELSPDILAPFVANLDFEQPLDESILADPLDDTTLRELGEDGKIHALPIDAYDAQILSYCPKFTHIYRVVGDCLGHNTNDVGDAFFLWRIAELHRAGHIEYQLPYTSIRELRIRRVKK